MATAAPPLEPQTPLEVASVQAQQRLREIAAAAVAQAWANLGSYSDEDIAGFLATVIPLVLVAQRQAVSLTDAYVARALERPPLGINPADIIPLIRGGGAAVPGSSAPDAATGTPSALVPDAAVAPEVVYRRPFVTTWTALSEGKSYAQAVREGQRRAASAASTDVLLAMTHAATEIGRRDKTITGWERVPDANACPLCLVASTQRYHSDQLMPIHDNCNCGIRPITDPDVGRIINKDRYRELKRAGVIDKITAQRQARRARERAAANRERAEATRRKAAADSDARRRRGLEAQARALDSRADRQDVLADAPDVAVRFHGELGPVLTNAAHAFSDGLS